MTDIIKKIERLYEEKKLRVAFIRLGKGVEFQKLQIASEQLFIGYSSGKEDIFKEINNKDLSIQDFTQLVKTHGDQNNLEPSALKLVYEDNGETLWFTIVDGLLYYGFTNQDCKFAQHVNEKNVINGCVRPMCQGWHKSDREGKEINERSVSGKITKKRIFRGTTSEVDSADIKYLVFRILNKKTREKKYAEKAQSILLSGVQALLPQLNEYDFETLVEMLFLGQGYEKIAKSSGAEKSFDLALKRPFDISVDKDKPTFVQIKSAVDEKVIKEVYQNLIEDKSFMNYHDDGFLVSHGFNDDSEKVYQDLQKDENKKLLLIGVEDIAKQCIDFGKVNWLLGKVV